MSLWHWRTPVSGEPTSDPRDKVIENLTAQVSDLWQRHLALLDQMHAMEREGYRPPQAEREAPPETDALPDDVEAAIRERSGPGSEDYAALSHYAQKRQMGNAQPSQIAYEILNAEYQE